MDIVFIFPIIIFLFILVQGFFSNSEMAMVSSNLIRLQYMASKGSWRAKIIITFLGTPERLFGTTLVGVNLSTVIATSLSDYYFEQILPGAYPGISKHIPIAWMPILIMHPMIVLFGELFPNTSARKYPNTTALRNAPFIKISYYFFFPLMLFVSTISRLVGKLFKGGTSSFGSISRDELQLIFNGKFENANKMTRKVVDDVLRIKELTAEDLMVHLNEVKAVSEDLTVEELKEMILSTNYSRFPVYRESIFNIVATVHAISILDADPGEPIKNYTEKLYIVPSSKRAVEILKELKTNRKYMAIVVDEYGAACGIITLENIAEEIVGDIRDEFDSEEEVIDQKNMLFDALTYLDDFYDATGIDLRNEDAETLSGIINMALGRIGRKGDTVEYKNKVRFDIVEATDRAVKTVKVTPLFLQGANDK